MCTKNFASNFTYSCTVTDQDRTGKQLTIHWKVIQFSHIKEKKYYFQSLTDYMPSGMRAMDEVKR
jgi:hypothetical protein